MPVRCLYWAAVMVSLLHFGPPSFVWVNRAAMKQIDIVNWYLEDREKAGVITDEEQLKIEMRKVISVIRRLVTMDFVLIEVPGPDGGEPAVSPVMSQWFGSAVLSGPLCVHGFV